MGLAIAIFTLAFLALPQAVFAFEKETRLERLLIFFLVYGLGLLVTILFLVVIAKRKNILREDLTRKISDHE